MWGPEKCGACTGSGPSVLNTGLRGGGLRKVLLSSWSQMLALPAGNWSLSHRDIPKSVKSLCQGTGAHSMPASAFRSFTLRGSLCVWMVFQVLPLPLPRPAYLFDSEATRRVEACHVGLPLNKDDAEKENLIQLRK